MAQLGYHLSSDALIYCDSETIDWDADVSIQSLCGVAGRALELSKSVTDGFREIKQDVYKVSGIQLKE